MFYAFCHNWSIVLCETKSKLFPARIPNYQAVFRKVWILYKFGFVGKSKLLDFTTMPTATESLFPFFHKILLLDKIEQFIAIPFSRNGKKWSKFIKSIDF